MIIQLLITIALGFLTILFGWLPSVDSLPFGIDSAFITLVSYFRGAIQTLPYMQVVWNCFLYLLGFEILMVVLKFFLGHRAPGHSTN